MEINAWTSTEFLGAGRAAGDARWTARLKRADGTERMMRPAHIVLATSQVGVPNIPYIPGFDAFGGTVIHSSGFAGGAAWAGRRALVIGTGTSAHDIAQELHAFGAEATMVQRGVTEVFQIEPSAHLYLDALYEQPGPDLEVKDLIACSVPMDVGTAQQRLVTPVVRRHDKDLLDRLERAGFRVERDPNGAGWPTKYLLRGGGYYFNVGCSDLIADGAIGIVQYDDIERWEADGPVLRDGRRVPVDLVVLATGFKGFEEALPRWFGAETAARIGKVWGLDPVTREVSNMWTRTAEPGLWFTGGSFVHSRIYSKYLALQIKQDLTNARS
jgi:putative flavoprotein involved in K+ transport